LCRRFERLAIRALARIGAPQPEHGFLVAACNAVHRDRQYRTAGGVGALDQRLGDLPARRCIELKPDRRAARLGDVLDRIVRRRRQHLHVIADLGRLRDGDLAIGMKKLVAAGRAHEDR